MEQRRLQEEEYLVSMPIEHLTQHQFHRLTSLYQRHHSIHRMIVIAHHDNPSAESARECDIAFQRRERLACIVARTPEGWAPNILWHAWVWEEPCLALLQEEANRLARDPSNPAYVRTIQYLQRELQILRIDVDEAEITQQDLHIREIEEDIMPREEALRRDELWQDQYHHNQEERAFDALFQAQEAELPPLDPLPQDEMEMDIDYELPIDVDRETAIGNLLRPIRAARLPIDGRECDICTQTLGVNHEAVKLPCGHHFGQECITMWLMGSSTCPFCRREYVGVLEPKPHQRAPPVEWWEMG